MRNNEGIKELVIGLLRDHVPVYYYYHNYHHTLYVTEKAVEIAKYEGCTPAEIELVETAGLWHDTGYIETYYDHEVKSCLLARQYLPGFGFDGGTIERICGMIMATRIPQSPTNLLEEIVADADLEYLGTPEAGPKADDLFKEIRHLDSSMTREKWKQTEILFLRAHKYFTGFCKKHREPAKLAYLQSLVGNAH